METDADVSIPVNVANSIDVKTVDRCKAYAAPNVPWPQNGSSPVYRIEYHMRLG